MREDKRSRLSLEGILTQQQGGEFYSLHLLAARLAVHTGLSTDSISQQDMHSSTLAQPVVWALLPSLLKGGMLLQTGAEEGLF